DDAKYVDIEYTYNAEQLADNVTILPGANRQSVQATLTLKEEYQGSNFILEITEVWLHISVTEKTFATLTLNGENFAEEDLENGMRFEFGSVLAFTMLDGYFITDKDNNPITSITFTEEDQTYNRETNTFDVIIYADAIGQGFAKAYTFAFPYFLPAFSINGTNYTYNHNEDIIINLDLQEDEIIINFDETYLEKYDFTIDYYTITNKSGELKIGALPYTLQSAHIVDSFVIMCEGDGFMRSVVYVNVNHHNPFVLEEFTLAGFTETTTAYFAGSTRIDIDNAVIAYVEFTDEQLNSYTRVTAYSDFALTKPVNYLDLASYNYEITYFAVYDDEENLVAILPKQLIYNFTTKNGFEVGPVFDTQVFNTNGSSVAKVEFAVTNSDLTVSATLNGQSEIALNSAQTEDVTFRMELTYSDRTFFFESTWTILKHYDASQRIVATGMVQNTNPKYKDEAYQIVGNNINLSQSYYFNAGNIESFEDELEYLAFETLSEYSIAERSLVKIGNEFFIELTFVDGEGQDAGKCLIKILFTGSYDNNTGVEVYAYGFIDGSQTQLTITNDTITLTDLNSQILTVAPNNAYAYVIITDSQGNKVADSSNYGYVMAQFKNAGTYSLIVYATDGTTKTYVVVVEGDYIPALSITIGQNSYVLEISVEEGLTGDYYSDSEGNLVG
ncbi:MAG: hypothetical protein IKY15_02955, partial [Clostridia bacterium]|nr:hypothetical protein [Clostridia bacterium]